MKTTLMRLKTEAYFQWAEYIETDYTGRWKIVVTDGIPILWLECFEIKETETVIDQEPCMEFFKVDRNFMGFKWEEDELRTVIPSKLVAKKVRANVNWVSEKSLKLSISEEFINQCGSHQASMKRKAFSKMPQDKRISFIANGGRIT